MWHVPGEWWGLGTHMPAQSSHKLSAAMALVPVSGSACQGKLCGCLQPQGLGKHCCGMGILNCGLAFLVFDQEIKLPGFRFIPPGEAVLAAGRCSLQEKPTQQPWHSRAFPMARLPLFCVPGRGRGPHPTVLQECTRGDACLVWINHQAAKIFKNLPSLAKALWISKMGWRITRSCCPSSCLVLPAGVRNTSCLALLTGISAVSLPHPTHGKKPVSSNKK